MKRLYKKEFVSSIWSLFAWKRCEKCEMEFRRGYGWVTVRGPFFRNRGTDVYLCSQCAPTKQDAENIFMGLQEALDAARLAAVRNTKPPPPPPVPCVKDRVR